MNPTPVAPTPKDIAPQRASPPPLPAIGTAFDQLLSIGLASPQQAPKTDAAQPSTRPKAKSDSDDTNAAAAAGAVPAPAPQLLPAITVATSSGQTTVATAALPASVVKPPALATGTGLDPDGPGGANPNTAGAKLPPGAAELEARIVAGTPGYLSQPNATLAGLWHHASENAKATAGQTGDASSPSAGATSEATSNATQTQLQTQAKDAASLGKQLPDQPLATPGIEIAQSAAADSGKSGTAATIAADGTSAAAAALPGPVDAPLVTPQVASTDPTLTSPVQISPAWEQVAVNLRQAAQSGTDRIEIQLKPASLGAIAVKLDLTHDGRITAVISADRSDTLNLLRQHSDGLAQSLRDAGLQADSGSLSFNLRGDPQSFAQSQAPTVSAVRSDEPAVLSSARAESPRYRHHAGAVDIEV